MKRSNHLYKNEKGKAGTSPFSKHSGCSKRQTKTQTVFAGIHNERYVQDYIRPYIVYNPG